MTAVSEQLLWFIGGFLAGCVATYLVLIKRALDPHHREPSMPSTDTPKLKRRNRFTWMHAIGLVVLVLTILAAIQSWRAQQSNARLQEENARLTACLVTYANATADAIDVRSKASAEAQVALVQMWSTIFAQPQTDAGKAEARRVFEDWLNKAKGAIAAQQANPFPAAPRDVCPDAAK